MQCAIPAFEGLLDALHNKLLLDLFFDLAMWHAFAKLHLHTDSTLSVFKQWTHLLGKMMQTFVQRVCPCFATQELLKETMAHH